MSDEPATPTAVPLTRQAISDAVSDDGWRYVLGALRTSVTVSSAAQGADVAARVVAACGADADGSLALDLGARSEQLLEIAVDAADTPAVRPFWKAVLGYDDEPGAAGPEDALVDPVGQGPAVWFQQMEPPRSGRNRIHLDVSVPHDEAQQRVTASLAAGGVLVSDAHAPAFWVLADPEGNEVCVTTWQGRD